MALYRRKPRQMGSLRRRLALPKSRSRTAGFRHCLRTQPPRGHIRPRI